MNNVQSDENLFEIKVKFEKEKGNPSRVFRAMSDLIESVQILDQHLSATLSTSVQTKLVLKDIETGSIKAILKNIVEKIPDEAIKEGDYKKLIGHFLHKAKHKILDWCSERDEIKDREEVKSLQGRIEDLAKETNLKHLPVYAPLETSTLLSDINSIKDSLTNLDEKDTATFSSQQGISQFNKKLMISENIVKELITRETILSEGERILKVKKPDYLGESKWVFKYSGHLIDAKILDKKWLDKFQKKVVTVQPGDSLHVNMKEEISYGYDSEIVHTSYEIIKVLKVIPAPKIIQKDLF